MLSYSSDMLDSMWVIISTSTIINPNFFYSLINSSSLVIHYYGSLVTSSNSVFVDLLCNIFLGAPIIGCNFLFNFPHARKAPQFYKSLVTYS